MNPEEENRENKKEEKFSIGSDNLVKLIVAGFAIVFAVYMIFTQGSSTSDSTDGCEVNTQSMWGQSPSAVWVELSSYAEAKAIAEFDFEYPETPIAEYTEENFRAYRKQVFEVYWTDSSGEEGIRFSKAYTCNGLEVYPPDEGTFRSTLYEDVNGIEAKEYGDGETVSIIFWVKGDYSYTILAIDHPLAKDEMEALIAKVD